MTAADRDHEHLVEAAAVALVELPPGMRLAGLDRAMVAYRDMQRRRGVGARQAEIEAAAFGRRVVQAIERDAEGEQP
ncbi:MAG: hypothetical protein AB7O63_13165 [Reyranellaceae bacterium]